MTGNIAWHLALIPAVLPGDGLPLTRHLPGTGTKPDRATLETVKKLKAVRIGEHNWIGDAQYRYGWHLFDNGYFWEAHELWEMVWLHTAVNSRERRLLQCLIQLANARLKRVLGKSNATLRLVAHCNSLRTDIFQPDQSVTGSSALGLGDTDLQQLIDQTL